MARVFAVAVALSAVLFVTFALPNPQDATTAAPAYTAPPGMNPPPSNQTGGYTAPPAAPPSQNGSYGQPEMTPPPNNYTMPGMPGR